ncbi:MAG TPA: hypothetical protein VKB57_13690 [Acidimicrobiales bacterium]|nr:hypothetical protein [Acidimicrobiales bacterium]
MSQDAPFDIRLQDVGGAAHATVLVAGEVDLSAVTFIDSGGLRTLLETNARQREAGLSPAVRSGRGAEPGRLPGGPAG